MILAFAHGQATSSSRRIFTIGHSKLPFADFLDLLVRNGIQIVIDIRSFPHSPRNPQFDIKALAPALEVAGVGYRHLPALGGRRSRGMTESPNRGWRKPAFRNYADYMQTDAFEAGLAELLEIASDRSAAYMCSEAVPWRCHRQLVSDCLVARGHDVLHIVGKGPPRRHRLTPFAIRSGRRVTYPGD